MKSSRLVYFIYIWNFIDPVICTTMGVYFDSQCTQLNVNYTLTDGARTWYTTGDGFTQSTGWYTVSNVNRRALLLTNLPMGCKVDFFTGSFTACPLDIVSTFEPNVCGNPGNASNFIFICSGESACASSISPPGAIASTKSSISPSSAIANTTSSISSPSGATTEVPRISPTTTGATGTSSSGLASPTGNTRGSNSSEGSSKFSSPSAIAGYAITALIIASIAVFIAWRQLRIAQKQLARKKIGHR